MTILLHVEVENIGIPTVLQVSTHRILQQVIHLYMYRTVLVMIIIDFCEQFARLMFD